MLLCLINRDERNRKNLAEELVSKEVIERSIATEIGVLSTPNVFSEDFKLGTTDGWNVYGGSWSAKTVLFTVESSSQSKAIVDQSNFSNFVYESQLITIFDSENNSDSSIIFRVKNPEVGASMYDGYYAGIDNSKKEVVLGKTSSITGENTIIKRVPIRNYADYAYYLKVRADGNNIKVYLDDGLYIDVYDDSYSSGAIGVRICKPGARLDNIVAYELTEEAEVNEGKISGKYNNYIKYFYDNTKKWYTSQAKNNKTFEASCNLPVNDETLINFTKELTNGIDDDYEKAKVIYDWVTKNIYYDSTNSRRDTYFDPKEVFEHKYTTCMGYSKLLATFINISGIPCIVVEGLTNYDKNENYYDGPHAWNEAYIDGRWVIMDSTWDTYNRYEDGEFKPYPKWNFDYFDPTLEYFSQDHKIKIYY